MQGEGFIAGGLIIIRPGQGGGSFLPTCSIHSRCLRELALLRCSVRSWLVFVGGVSYSHLEKTFGDYPPINEVRRRYMRARMCSCPLQEDQIVHHTRRVAAGAGSGKESDWSIAAAMPSRRRLLYTCTICCVMSCSVILSVVSERSQAHIDTLSPRRGVVHHPRAVLDQHPIGATAQSHNHEESDGTRTRMLAPFHNCGQTDVAP